MYCLGRAARDNHGSARVYSLRYVEEMNFTTAAGLSASLSVVSAGGG